MQTLTQYLSNIMNTVLLGLPTEIKELIYFDALSHAATGILVSFGWILRNLHFDNLPVVAVITRSQEDKSAWCRSSSD
jgi:hypothetical protein